MRLCQGKKDKGCLAMERVRRDRVVLSVVRRRLRGAMQMQLGVYLRLASRRTPEAGSLQRGYGTP